MNPVLYWNAILLECSRRDFTRGFINAQQPGPIATSRAMAIVHLAIHDAVAFRNLPAAAYLNKKGVVHGVPAQSGQQINDMIAGAAVTTLTAMYPKFSGYIDDSTGPTDAASFAYGKQIGQAMLAMRAMDGSEKPITGPQQPPVYGHHRADPYQSGQQVLGPQWGSVKRFCSYTPAGTHDHDHQALAAYPGSGAAPGTLPDNAAFRLDSDEVRDVGGVDRNARTAEQERIGVFWGYDGAMNLGVPPRLYNQILRSVAGSAMSTPEAAELFAMANVALADAGIDAWHWKYVYDLWRPVVGLREDSMKGGDAFWAPLGMPQTNTQTKRSWTPPFPSYPSGHATFGAALFQVVRLARHSGAGPIKVADVLAYDNNHQPAPNPAETFTFTSDELDGVALDPDGSTRTRVPVTFGSYAEAVWENAVSRVYLGVHWRFDGIPRNAADNIGGAPLGLSVGKEAYAVFNTGASLTGN